MEALYYTPSLPDSFGSKQGLKRQSGKRDTDIANFLIKQDPYTLHRDIKRRFRRRKTLALGIDDLWQIDLVDLSSISRSNNGYRYLLTCIDVFSKFARIMPIKNKMSVTVTDAFSEMIRDRKCKLLQSDKGSEFLNAKFQKLLSDNGIRHYTSENDDIKCAVVERFHRTILAKLYRYFTHANTTRYVDIIQLLVKSYNETRHSSIKMAPVEVTPHNESQIRERLYKTPRRVNLPKYNVGDTVRISGAKRVFAKGYRDKWSEEIFKVCHVYVTDPVTYGLTDYTGERIKGKFYAEELQKVVKEVFHIEKVLKTRVRSGRTEYYVKWLGYSDKFNSWVDDISV